MFRYVDIHASNPHLIPTSPQAVVNCYLHTIQLLIIDYVHSGGASGGGGGGGRGGGSDAMDNNH